MALVVHGILLLWLVVVPWACFSRVPRHWVLAAAFLLGLLFLPMVGGGGESNTGTFSPILLPGLALTKYKVISLAVLFAVLVTDGKRLAQFRPSWVDLPMVVWCLCPFPSVLGAPPPDSKAPLPTCISQCFGTFLLWGVPYFIGKLYFGSFQRLRDLAFLFVLSAILYVPLCLYEIRMSPQLHLRVFGFFQHDFLQSIRFGGYRPMVFMQHGLALGLFLVAATLVGFTLSWSGATKELLGDRWPKLALSFPYLLLLLALTTILDKSTGALAIGAVGIVVLVLARWPRTVLPLVCLWLVCPLYITGRTSGAWSGHSLEPLILQTLDPDRADSFAFRQANEDLLMERAFKGPTFGWGGWGRNLVHDKDGRIITVLDGLWIIVLGERGLPGLIALWLAMLLPVARYIWLQPVATWTQPHCAGATVCALVVVLYMIDNLMNNMHNHVFIAMAGGLAALSRPLVSEPPPPPSVTAREVFRRSLRVTRLLRSGMQQRQPGRDGAEVE